MTIVPAFENAKACRLLTIINGSVKEDSFIMVSDDLKDIYPFGLRELTDNTVPEVNIPDTATPESKNELKLQIAVALGISNETEKNY